ncbi:MAG: zinc transporter ZupT [Lachnospiraceae bacterium]|jgi:ZIP family zinc transporter|nr:zinc transporter ZupT [Lachnospiraceae bacterium]
MEHVLFSFILTTIAGLCTGLGSLIAFFSKKTNKIFLSVSLGVSAGVMIYVSMVELFQNAQTDLMDYLGRKMGNGVAVIAFFGGMALIYLVEKMVPGDVDPHDPPSQHGVHEHAETSGLMKTGFFTALAIAIHNFPEGLATFITALQAPDIALPIIAAIAIHNIPEGISVSVPIYYATGSRRKAFLYSLISGLTEPLGAIVGYLLLRPFLTPVLLGVVMAAVAGIMVFISFDELLPAAREYGEQHLSILGLVIGMAVMAFSLWMFL